MQSDCCDGLAAVRRISITMKILFHAMAFVATASAVPPVIYNGSSDVSPTADGGLRPVVGIHNIQVYRANRSKPEHSDGLTDTYVHAPTLCYWRGHFYLEYLSAPRNEHDNPTVNSLTRSVDGVNWEPPRVVFPAFALPDGTQTIAHQRMGFYVAPDGRLLVLGFYGKHPEPNDGTGIGRAVREVREDGSFGPIHFIRLNPRSAFPEMKLPYPFYKDSSEKGFVAACDALLADKLMTAQWWEEEQLDEADFHRIRGKALSYVTRPDGSVLGVWKNRLVATTSDRGQTWTTKEAAGNVPDNGSKYWLQRMGDGRYGLVLNPTTRNRYPLAMMTSADCITFGDLVVIHGELPDQRFGGHMKNMGPQYVRGILEGNGDPPDAKSAFYLTYSVNKEDIWFARVPAPATAVASGPVHDDFNADVPGMLPAGWNIYSPLWARVRIADEAGGRVLKLTDEDPCDYARAIRVFPATHGVKVSFKVFAKQSNSRLEIELLDGKGLRPVRLAFGKDGKLSVCHEAQWLDAGSYSAGKWHAFDLEIPANPEADRCAVLIDGRSPLPRPAYFTDAVSTVERLSFRTGVHRERGYGGRDLPGADVKAPRAEFLIDDVVITPSTPR
jgi:hypothetical protein